MVEMFRVRMALLCGPSGADLALGHLLRQLLLHFTLIKQILLFLLYYYMCVTVARGLQ